MSRYDNRIRKPARLRERITPDALEALAFARQDCRIEFDGPDAYLVVDGITYVAEFDIRSAVA